MARRKKKKNKKRKFLKAKFLYAFFLIIIFLGIIFFLGYKIYKSSLFELDRGSIQANFKVEESLAEKIEGKTIFDLNLSKIKDYIKKQHPEYKEVNVFRQFPDTIKIRIKKRKPIAQIISRQFYLVDQEGIIISQASRDSFSSYPLIEGIVDRNHLSKGDNIQSRCLKAAFDVIHFIRESDLLAKINSPDDGYHFELSLIKGPSFQTVYFYLDNQKSPANRIEVMVNRDEIKKKIDLLGQLLTQKLKDRISLVRYIDFRFDKVVVGFRR